uniref:Tetraspanin n=1 Tax=Phallusia mammillata TaxID=59560 RepID=A0A6F9DW93_9ASCI|nr:tetraspanin-8-like [Phallusia mammillata]
MEDCGKKCAKYLLIAFNIFVWIAGAAVLGVGIYLRVNNNIEAVITVADLSLYYSGCYVLITAGSMMFIIGFFGCCGAMTENKCLLGIYSVVLTIILILEVAVGIWAAVNANKIESEIEKAFNTTLKNGNDTNDALAQSMISVERQFQCCGLTNGCMDWDKSIAYGCGCDASKAPNGTCVTAASLGCTSADSSTYIWKEPCYDSVVDFIHHHIWVVVGIGIGIGLAEVLGIIFAAMVCRLSTKNSYGYIA